MKTIAEVNGWENPFVKAKRHRQQQFFTKLALMKYVKTITLPCKVTLTRLSPRVLDEDNFPTAFKYIRDEIAALLIPEKIITYVNKSGKTVKNKGLADSDKRISWHYCQEKSTQMAVKIDIEY